MKVSIYIHSIRPDLWLPLYESLIKNTVDIELIVAGYPQPSFSLPDNLKFIETFVKHPQAAQIARRACTGDYMLNMADDYIILPNVFDKFVDVYEKSSNKKLIVSGIYAWGGGVPADEGRFVNADPDSIVMPNPGNFISRELSDQVGGFDVNFYGTYFTEDVTLRLYNLGCEIIRLKDIIFNEIVDYCTGERLSYKCGDMDRNYLYSLWGIDGKNLTRAKPVEVYKDENILTINQGRII